jgi:O-antigen/teichoic acid export membrane protein
VRRLIAVRVLTLPVVAVALFLLLLFVDVRLPAGAFVGTLVWIFGVHVAVVAAAGLRATGNVRSEPLVAVIVRSAQAGLLLGLAWSGADVVTLVSAVAGVELVGALALCGALGSGWRQPTVSRPGELRRAAAFAAIEMASLLYIRADLLLVGHLLGPVAGATYALLYRFVDGAGGAVGTTGLWLFSNVATGRDGGDTDDGVRARAIRTLPRVAFGISFVGVAFAGLLGELVPRFAGDTQTLRLLIAAFPMLAFNGLELYVRSARGRNRSVLAIGLLALVINIALCLILVPEHGLLGAAIALIVAEALQTCAVLSTVAIAERHIVAPAAATTLLGTGALVGFTVVIGSPVTTAMLVAAAACVALVVHSAPPRAEAVS